MYQLPINSTAVITNDTKIEIATIYPKPDTNFMLTAAVFCLLSIAIFFIIKRHFWLGLISTSLWLNYNLCFWPYLIITKNCDDLEQCYQTFTLVNFIIANGCIIFLILTIIGRAKLPEKYLTIRVRYYNTLVYAIILIFLGSSSYVMTMISMIIEKDDMKYLQLSLYTLVTLAGTVSFLFLVYFHKYTPDMLRDYFHTDLLD